MNTAQKTCQYCGRRLSKNGKYCNRTCMGKAYRNRVTLTCETCGEAFDAKPAQVKNYNARFCSVDCKAIGTRVGEDSICEHCGTGFYIRPSKVGRHGAGRYCSRECRDEHWRTTPEANSHWKGGRSPMKYRGRAVQWRKRVLHRDRETCQDCGVVDPSNHAHHIYPWRDWPNLRYSTKNGRTLCRACHEATYGREGEYVKHLGLPPTPPSGWAQ